MANKPFQLTQLSRGCSIAVVLSGVLIFLIGACVFRLSQLPNDLGSGLGRGGHIANILVVAQPGHRQRLAIFENGEAGLEFLDKAGIFDRAQSVTLTPEEWQTFSMVYQAWCENPPERHQPVGEQVYSMGFSCGMPFGRYIVVPETQTPPILLQLLKRVVTKQP